MRENFTYGLMRGSRNGALLRYRAGDLLYKHRLIPGPLSLGRGPANSGI
jgi:hypothetical protein